VERLDGLSTRRDAALRTASSSRSARDGIFAAFNVSHEGAMKKAERWFYPGERVRVYYRSVGEWKEATIRSMIPLPRQRSPNPSFYRVTCEGKQNPRYYRPKELQPLKRTASMSRSRVRAKRAAPRASQVVR
jgi:hypothetical protein